MIKSKFDASTLVRRWVCCRDAIAESAEEMTPLKQKLDDFGNFLSKVGVLC